MSTIREYASGNSYYDTLSSIVSTKIDTKGELTRREKIRRLRRRKRKKRQAKEYIASLMKPTEKEMEYMERFIAKEYKPELLFEDPEIIERLRNHPMALWKCK